MAGKLPRLVLSKVIMLPNWSDSTSSSSSRKERETSKRKSTINWTLESRRYSVPRRLTSLNSGPGGVYTVTGLLFMSAG